MGGGSTWDHSAVYGQNLAAIVPVCGGTMPIIAVVRNIAAKNLPAWTISSTKHKIVHIWWATSWNNWIKLYNPDNANNVKLTIYTSGESHNAAWLRPFNPSSRVEGSMCMNGCCDTEVVAAPVPPSTSTSNKPPIANAGKDIIIHKFWNFNPLLNGTLSKDPDGWLSYVTWTKISGPASYSFANRGPATRVSRLKQGVYIFRFKVTDNRGAKSADDVRITVLP